jgi:Leucine-rich repeat (LRR) protein
METLNRCKIILALTFLAFSTLTYSQSSTSKVSLHNRQNQPSNFIKFFPDTSLAILVAERLNKKVTDNVSIKELASIKGYFEVGPGKVSNLKGIGYLIGIDSFNCYKNEVTEIPAEFGNLVNLKSLDLCKAFSLKKIPAQIGKLKHLSYIRLCLTEITAIPKEIGNLTELQTLWLCCNSLTEIPKEIGRLKNLQDVDIHSNNIKSLPDEICNLTSLTSLNISHCGLEKLPDNIGNLKGLEIFNLFNNNLRQLPHSIKRLDNLSDLNVFDNFKLSESYKKYLPKLLKKKG